MSKAQRTPPTKRAAAEGWPAQSSWADRRRARENICLSDVGVTEATLERYYTAVNRLRPILETVESEYQLDLLLSEWIQDEFEDGCPLHLVGDALSGLHHFDPCTKKKIPRSWRLYGIWRRFEVPCRAPPLPQDITLGMAGWCLQHNELVMGGLILLGFHGLLRTGELLQVRPCDFLMGDTHALVSLPASKSGVRNNSKESISLTDLCAVETVRAMVQLQKDQQLDQVPCWVHSGSAFRTLFRRVLVEMKVADLGFRPYSLRRGGATFEMASHGLMEKTLIRGRWKNSNIARIYISDGLSRLPSLKMTWEAKFQVARYSSVFTNEQHSFCAGKRGRKARASS